MLAGTQTTLGTTGRGPVRPFVRVAVDWPVVQRLNAFAEADLTGLPDSQVRLTTAKDFDAIEMSVGVNWRPSTKVHAAGYCEAGFASRLETDGRQPREGAPLWASCGVWFREKAGGHGGRLRIGLGPDERPGWGPVPTAHVKGSIKVLTRGNGSVVLSVRAVLGLARNPYGHRTNVITAGVGAGWGG